MCGAAHIHNWPAYWEILVLQQHHPFSRLDSSKDLQPGKLTLCKWHIQLSLLA